MIKKVKGGYKAATNKGRPLSKRPKTKSAAKRQLAAVALAKKTRRK